MRKTIRGRALAVRNQLQLLGSGERADQIQLYKLICRQVATRMGFTASSCPAVVGVTAAACILMSRSARMQKPVLDAQGEECSARWAWSFIDRILTHGNDICLMLNASVNAYRRLDPHFEAPNQIKASPWIAAP